MELPMNNLTKYFAKKPTTPEEARWYCEQCGWIEPRRSVIGDLVRFLPARCACQVAKEERTRLNEQARAWRESAGRATFNWLGAGIPNDLALLDKTFETFDPSKQRDAYELAREFVTILHGTFILHGGFGIGKTHLLASICNEAREHQVSSFFTTAPKLFSAIQEHIGHHESYAHLLHKASTTRLLVIDDIDKAKYSEFREETYFTIIDERTKNGLPIAISTNRLADIASFVGGACASRLRIGQIEIEMSGDDYRGQL